MADNTVVATLGWLYFQYRGYESFSRADRENVEPPAGQPKYFTERADRFEDRIAGAPGIGRLTALSLRENGTEPNSGFLTRLQGKLSLASERSLLEISRLTIDDAVDLFISLFDSRAAVTTQQRIPEDAVQANGGQVARIVGCANRGGLIESLNGGLISFHQKIHSRKWWVVLQNADDQERLRELVKRKTAAPSKKVAPKPKKTKRSGAR